MKSNRRLYCLSTGVVCLRLQRCNRLDLAWPRLRSALSILDQL